MILSLTKQQYFIVIMLTSVHAMNSAQVFIRAPLYPKVAEEKGIDAIFVSSVFASYNLAWFLYNPFCRVIVTRIGPYVVAKTSIFIIGVTNILFGYIDKIHDAFIFLCFSYILRIVEAYGFATFDVSAFCIVAKEFPDDIGTILGILNTGQGIGSCLGPAIGGALYIHGGFTLPFISFGLFTVVIGIIAFFIKGSDIDVLLPLRYKDCFTILKKTECILALLPLLTFTLSLGTYNVTLEPHLRMLNLSPGDSTLFFALMGFFYCVFSLPFGKLCDMGLPPHKLWCIGVFLISISLMCLGPSPFLKVPLTAPTCYFGVILSGIGASAIVVSSFFCLHKISLKIGLPDDIRTYGLVSSIFNSVYAIGMMTGEMIGGIFSETIGIPWGFQILSLFYILIIIATLIYDYTHKDNDFQSQSKAS